LSDGHPSSPLNSSVRVQSFWEYQGSEQLCEVISQDKEQYGLASKPCSCVPRWQQPDWD
jgi:hypothetical protein